MDFSPTAIDVARWVAETLTPRAEIVLAHALEPVARPSFLVAEMSDPSALEATALADAEGRLREIASRFGAGHNLTSVARVGQPHDVITEVARASRADLIAVGAHGNRAHESWLLGTTADRLVRSAHLPVLVGPRDTQKASGRVLAGIDDDPTSRLVLAYAGAFARQLDARLTVLYVLSNATYSFIASLAAAHAHGDREKEDAELREELHGQSRQWLADCVAVGADPARVDIDVDWGAASERILEHAKQESADLIVLGRRRATLVVPGLIGGTAVKVLHGARCGVVIVPPASRQA